MIAVLAQAGLLPANLDALVPVALVSLLVWREVRRAEAGPASEPAPHRADRLIVPLLALFAIIVVLELVRML
ncbi:MAG TPA: hypothetical protein VGJ32_08690 [Solirubrobacteraceae bacterium]|jgi:hypothetical protein